MAKQKPQTKITELRRDCEAQPPKPRPKRNIRAWRICHAVLTAVITIYAFIMLLLYFLRSGSAIVNISLLFNLVIWIHVRGCRYFQRCGRRVTLEGCRFLVPFPRTLVHYPHARASCIVRVGSRILKEKSVLRKLLQNGG